MEIKFNVHNPHSSNMFVAAQVDGETIPAEMRIFEVELMTTDGLSGTLKLRFKGERAAAARELFAEGNSITAVFSGAAVPAEGEAEPAAA